MDFAKTDELEPWIVIQGQAAEQEGAAEVAMWQPLQSQQPAVACFSSQELATQYAQQHCGTTARIVKLGQRQMVRLFIECYRAGTKFAVLDPSADSVRQAFEIRAVLSAAKKQL